jgi:hypothetical protein
MLSNVDLVKWTARIPENYSLDESSALIMTSGSTKPVGGNTLGTFNLASHSIRTK